MAYSLRASGIAVPDTYGKKNRIINGSFLITQRLALAGTVFVTDNIYEAADRWRGLTNGASTVMSTNTAGALSDGWSPNLFSINPNSQNVKLGVINVCEAINSVDLRGQPVSMQVVMRNSTGALSDVRAAMLSWSSTADGTTGDPISAWGAAGTNPTLAANWAYINTPVSASTGIITPTTGYVRYKFENFTCPTNMNNLAVLIWLDDTSSAGDFAVFRDVQVERGPVCTEIERRFFQEELALCQRYYAKTYPYASVGGAATELGALSYNAANAGVSTNSVMWRYPVPMRTTPAISTWGTSGTTGTWRNVTDAAASGAAATAALGETSVLITNPQAAGDGVGERISIHATAAAEL